jgi:hypothetical protein
MQLTPQTAAEIHRIFDGRDADDLERAEDDDDEPYAPAATRLMQLRAALAWLASQDASDPDGDDERDRD